jgi:hypothetical protein
MAEVGVDERVSDECPDVGGPTAGPRDVRQHTGVVTRGNEREQQQKLGRLLRRQHEHEDRLDDPEHDEQRDHDRGHVEHPFAARLIEHGS